MGDRLGGEKPQTTLGDAIEVRPYDGRPRGAWLLGGYANVRRCRQGVHRWLLTAAPSGQIVVRPTRW